MIALERLDLAYTHPDVQMFVPVVLLGQTVSSQVVLANSSVIRPSGHSMQSLAELLPWTVRFM